MTVDHETDTADRDLPVPPAAEPRFEKGGAECRPDQGPLYPVGTPFAAIIGWW